jgi:hypothetical protein
MTFGALSTVGAAPTCACVLLNKDDLFATASGMLGACDKDDDDDDTC